MVFFLSGANQKVISDTKVLRLFSQLSNSILINSFSFVLSEELSCDCIFQVRKFLCTHANLLLKVFCDRLRGRASESLLYLELGESTQRLEGSEKLYVLDHHVELARNYIESHSLVGEEYIVRDVGLNEVVKYNTCTVSKSILSIF